MLRLKLDSIRTCGVFLSFLYLYIINNKELDYFKKRKKNVLTVIKHFTKSLVITDSFTFVNIREVFLPSDQSDFVMLAIKLS